MSESQQKLSNDWYERWHRNYVFPQSGQMLIRRIFVPTHTFITLKGFGNHSILRSQHPLWSFYLIYSDIISFWDTTELESGNLVSMSKNKATWISQTHLEQIHVWSTERRPAGCSLHTVRRSLSQPPRPRHEAPVWNSVWCKYLWGEREGNLIIEWSLCLDRRWIKSFSY